MALGRCKVVTMHGLGVSMSTDVCKCKIKRISELLCFAVAF